MVVTCAFGSLGMKVNIQLENLPIHFSISKALPHYISCRRSTSSCRVLSMNMLSFSPIRLVINFLAAVTFSEDGAQ